MHEHLSILYLNFLPIIWFRFNRFVDFRFLEYNATPSDWFFLYIRIVMTFIRYFRIDSLKSNTIAWIIMLNIAIEVLYLSLHRIVAFNRYWFVIRIIIYLYRRIRHQTLRCFVIWLFNLLPLICSHGRLLILCLVWMLEFMRSFWVGLVWWFQTIGPTYVLAIHFVILILLKYWFNIKVIKYEWSN